MTELDRLARAAFPREYPETARKRTRAVLTAMRDEPSEGAVDSGARAKHLVGTDWSQIDEEWVSLPDYAANHHRDEARAAVVGFLDHILTEGGQ